MSWLVRLLDLILNLNLNYLYLSVAITPPDLIQAGMDVIWYVGICVGWKGGGKGYRVGPRDRGRDPWDVGISLVSHSICPPPNFLQKGSEKVMFCFGYFSYDRNRVEIVAPCFRAPDMRVSTSQVHEDQNRSQIRNLNTSHNTWVEGMPGNWSSETAFPAQQPSHPPPPPHPAPPAPPPPPPLPPVLCLTESLFWTFLPPLEMPLRRRYLEKYF